MDSILGLIFFFFQAEDGIRDRNVTGVQTCALPISTPARATSSPPPSSSPSPRGARRWPPPASPTPPRASASAAPARSEERRVGKECRSRWSPDHEKKK